MSIVPFLRATELAKFLEEITTWDFQNILQFFRFLFELEKSSAFRNLIFSDNMEEVDPETYDTLGELIAQKMGPMLDCALQFFGKLEGKVECESFDGDRPVEYGNFVWILGDKYLSKVFWICTRVEHWSYNISSDIYAQHPIVDTVISIRPQFPFRYWEMFFDLEQIFVLFGIPREIMGIIVVMMVK